MGEGRVVSARAARVGITKRAVWNLSAAHLMNDLMTAGIVPALLPLYRAAFHLSYTQAGLIVLVSFLTSSVFQPVFGFVSDRRPRVWFLPLGVFLSCAGLALTGIAPSYPWLLFFIALSGLGSGAFHPEASRGTHLAAGNAKGMAQAIFQVGGNAGQALGPMMVPLLILATGLRGLLLFLVLAGAALFVTWRLLPWYRTRVAKYRMDKKKVEGRNRIAGVSLLVMVVVLRSWCQIGVTGFLPFFYARQQIPLSRSEWFNFLFLAAGAVGTFIGGTLSDQRGKKWLLVGSMALSVPFAWILPYAKGVWAALDLILFGFLVLSSFAVTVVYAQWLLPRNIGLASGLMIGFGVGAGGIGATLLGYIADRFGVATVFKGLVFLPATAALLSVFLTDDRALAKS
jgi:FSR family fosmidomycin resistance protein-like MFS transporter